MYLVFLIYCITQICSEVHMILNVRNNKVQEPQSLQVHEEMERCKFGLWQNLSVEIIHCSLIERVDSMHLFKLHLSLSLFLYNCEIDLFWYIPQYLINPPKALWMEIFRRSFLCDFPSSYVHTVLWWATAYLQTWKNQSTYIYNLHAK